MSRIDLEQDDNLDISFCIGVASMNTTHRARICAHQAEPDIVVAIVRRVVVPIRRAAVLGVVVPAAATFHAVLA